MRLFLIVLSLAALPLRGATTVTLIHFSDYHSHALPHYSEERLDQGGIARAVAYMKRAKGRGALIFSGGDMVNRGSPAWSDKYRCAEWPWLNGLVDAMAYGNHDSDYGPDVFAQCRASLRYPIVSANVLDADGRVLFPRYVILKRKGVRIGVFAVAGRDYETLVRPALRPAAGVVFGDPVDAARRVVRELREHERVDAVVMIGHQHRDADIALARDVPGIDVIFGSHTHHKEPLTRIEGTKTWFISAFQYLTYLSRVELTFDGGKLKRVRGNLVRVDESIEPDREIAGRVASMQRDLETDPEYRHLFERIGEAAEPLSIEGQTVGDSALGNLALDVMRRAAGADVALSTASSFRQPIAPGAIVLEDLRAALPYDNEIVVYEMRGGDLRRLLAFAASKRGTDFFAQISGVRIAIDAGGRLAGDDLDEGRTYKVVTTDYLAAVATGYREFFAGLARQATGLRVREELRKHIAAHSPVRAARDGRIETRDRP